MRIINMGVVLFLLMSLCFGQGIAAQPSTQSSNQSPVGYWDQVDDHTGQLQSIIVIWQKNQELQGRVVAGFPINGKEPDHFCTKCVGDFKGKRIIHLTLFWGAVFNPKTQRWEGGHILDPVGGHIYHVTLTLKDQGQTLSVRGYIGISLFGRSQLWTRITKKEMQAQLATLPYQEL